MAAINWICWIVGSLFLGLGGLWFALALFRDRARGRRRCPKCWYDMAGVPGLTCPECGKTFAAERTLTKTRRHRRQAVAALVVVFVGYAGVRTPDVISEGPIAVVPALPLRVVVSFFDEYSGEPDLSVLGGPVNPNVGLTASQFLVTPRRPVAPPASPTWWERTELDWKKLQQASRARKRIRAAIRLARSGSEQDQGLADMHIRSARSDLWALGVESKIALDAMRALVNQRKLPEELRLDGMEMLIGMGDDVEGAKRTLRRVVRGKRQPVALRLAALEGLVSLGEEAFVYRSALRDLMSRADWWDRSYRRTSVKAAKIAMNSPAPDATEELINAFQSGGCVTRSAIRHVIMTSNSTSAVARTMKDFLQAEYAASTRSAIEALEDADRAVRLIAARELRHLPQIGSADAERCLDALERTSDPVEQRYLIELFRRMQIKGERVNELLRGRVGVEESIDLGYSTLHAAHELCPEEIVVEIAIQSLDDPYPHTRYLAAWILRHRADAALSALPALWGMMDDEIGSVRKVSAEAIEMIEDAARERQGQSSVESLPIGGP